MLDKLIEAPTKEEQDEEDYEDDVKRSESGNAGRCASTGY